LRRMERARIEVRWVFAVSDVMTFELQWKKAEDPWHPDYITSIRTIEESHVTPSLHPGSVYVFRVRGSMASYAGSKWSPFSQTSVPMRPMVKDPVVIDEPGRRARNLTEARRMLEKLGRPMAPVDGTEIDTIVSFPATEMSGRSLQVVPPRRRGDDGASNVSSSVLGPSQTEIEVEREVRAAAAAAYLTSAAAGYEAESAIAARMREIDDIHRSEKERLRELKDRHADLVRTGKEEELQQIIKLQGKIEGAASGKVRLPPTPATVSASEVASVSFRVAAEGNDPMGSLD